MGRIPPFQEWAEASVSVRNEFTDRDKLVAEARKPFEDMYAATAGIGALQLRMGSQFSQYDGDRKAYYLTAFTPGTSLSFRSGKYVGRIVSLQLDNLLKAQLWAMPPEAAQELLRRHPGRSLMLDVTIRLTGAEMRSSGPQLKGHVEKLDVYADNQLVTTLTP
jgi:hypothetical protein